MDFTDFKAGINDNGRRLDKVIRIIVSELSLGEIYKALRKGLIKLNNKKADPDVRIKTGDIIQIADFLTDKKQENNAEQKIILPPVIFQNEHLLVLNKPYNMLVQESKNNKDSLNTLVQKYYEINSTDTSVSFKTGPLHRLDKNTSGLLCFSWSLKGAVWFSDNLRDHKIQKKYRGIVFGNLKDEEIWQDKIIKEEDSNEGFHTVKIQNDEEPNAYTKITPLAHGKYMDKDITYAEFNIKTGKMHQIRSQSAFHGFPLLGDTAYGAFKISEKREYFLHAWTLTFPQNELGIPDEIKCPLPKDFDSFLLKTCDIKNPGL